MKEAIELSIRHDVEEFNDRKRERYINTLEMRGVQLSKSMTWRLHTGRGAAWRA